MHEIIVGRGCFWERTREKEKKRESKREKERKREKKREKERKRVREKTKHQHSWTFQLDRIVL